MQIDKQTMLFVDMTDEEANDLYKLAEAVVMTGVLPHQSTLFLQWYEACGFDERQSMLIAAAVFPCRALLSVCKHRSVCP